MVSRGTFRFGLGLGLGLTMFVAVSSAQAGTITPTTTADVVTNDAVCSLREAITAAQTDGDYFGCLSKDDGDNTVDENADSIELAPGSTYAVNDGTGEDANINGDLDITGGEALTIESSGSGAAAIAGGGNATSERVLDIDATADQTLRRLTIAGGNQGGVSPANSGGAIRFDLGTPNTLRIEDSAIAHNTAGGAGGGVHQFGGHLVVERTTFLDNHASGGGAYANQLNDGAVDQKFNEVTFADNTATGLGGAIYGIGASTIALRNSTITGNSSNGPGGGIASQLSPLRLSNTTVAGNTADADADDSADGGGIAVSADITISNTLVAANTDASPATKVPDCFVMAPHTVLSLGYNLLGTSTGGCSGSAPFIGSAAGDLVGTTPSLGPLADNGGPTMTRALLPGSAGIDAGNPEGPLDGDLGHCEATDQRGVARPIGARCDIGAFEAPLPATVAPPPAPPGPPSPGKRKCKKKKKGKKRALAAKKKKKKSCKKRKRKK